MLWSWGFARQTELWKFTQWLSDTNTSRYIPVPCLSQVVHTSFLCQHCIQVSDKHVTDVIQLSVNHTFLLFFFLWYFMFLFCSKNQLPNFQEKRNWENCFCADEQSKILMLNRQIEIKNWSWIHKLERHFSRKAHRVRPNLWLIK